MGKRYTIIVIISLLLISGCTFDNSSTTENKQQNSDQTLNSETIEDSVENTIAQLILTDLGLTPSEDLSFNQMIRVDISSEEDSFIQGNAKIWDGEEGRVEQYLATDKNGKWELIFHGNGKIDCKIAIAYEVPEDMIPECEEKTRYQPTEAEKIVQDLFAERFDKDPATLIVMFEAQRDNHMRGLIKMSDEVGDQRIFLVSDTLGEWEIVYDESDRLYCEDVAPYDFPDTMISDCNNKNEAPSTVSEDDTDSESDILETTEEEDPLTVPEEDPNGGTEISEDTEEVDETDDSTE